MNAILTERILAIAQAAEKAGHGGKDAVYQTGCQALGISKATLLRKIKQVSVKPPRKQRVDCGTSALTREEALQISGVMMASHRKNGKRLYSLEQAVNDLRANNLINAGYMDNETGEWFPLSVDAISRALYQYRLHPNQLRAPTPCVQLKTDHPNHVWQLDASLCVLYYLKNPAKGRTKRDSGLRMMSEAEFNKNKPKNLDRIVNDRVWSFELTDHTSGWIYAEYRFGGETTQNFTDVLINAMQERGGADVLHGVPRILYTDPGCALVSSTLRNLCKTLGIQLIAHKAGNARATGSVEKARDILECHFESGLRFVQVNHIDELNRLVGLWRKKYNRTALHRRTGMTRTDCWLHITPAQLIKAPPVDVCRELAVSLPENRKVTTHLRVLFRGSEYDVRQVPGVCVGDIVQIVRNPWRDSEAQVVMMNEDGQETFCRVPEVAKDDYGFALNSPTLGESFKALPHTPAQHHLSEVEQTLYGTTTPGETAAAQKANALPFGGRFNPYLDNERDTPPIYLPKQGQASPVCAPRFEERLNPVVVVQRLRARFQAAGKTWRSEFYTTLTQRFPDGIPADQVDALGDELMAQTGDVVVTLASHG
ncbi:integrase catalytic domain-containing protein [Arsenophonus nasoniae]|uniref:Transposase family protein n=1 Tax=Arsenophonus nasoniae TaxID=638 RepID=A0ABY8NPW0_9GAMM|nr:transposase family protein [Arsenophonus nasoniae]WGM05991.1 transposase family protein [Arsenophonus nasoniae]